MMARIAEALRTPVRDGHVHAIRWADGRYVLDAWPLEQVDTADPRTFMVSGNQWKVLALTSLSWLLPVELSPDGLELDRKRVVRGTSVYVRVDLGGRLSHQKKKN